MHQKQKIYLSCFLLTTCSIFTSAYAETVSVDTNTKLHGLYVGVEAGATRTLGTDVAPDWGNGGDYTWSLAPMTYQANLATVANFGLKIGFAVTKIINLDLAYNRRGNFKGSNGWDNKAEEIETGIITMGEKYTFNNINSQALTVNATLLPVTWNQFKPFVSAGLGIARNKFGGVRNDSINSDNAFVDGENKNSFTWQVGAGLEYNIAEHWDIDFAYRFVDMGNFTTSKNFTDLVSGQKSTIQPFVIKNLQANELYFTVKYNI